MIPITGQCKKVMAAGNLHPRKPRPECTSYPVPDLAVVYRYEVAIDVAWDELNLRQLMLFEEN